MSVFRVGLSRPLSRYSQLEGDWTSMKCSNCGTSHSWFRYAGSACKKCGWKNPDPEGFWGCLTLLVTAAALLSIKTIAGAIMMALTGGPDMPMTWWRGMLFYAICALLFILVIGFLLLINFGYSSLKSWASTILQKLKRKT